MKNLMMMLGISVMLMSCNPFDTICQAQEKNLTPETTIGANTMSCKIDGKIFVDQVDGHGDCRGGIYAYPNKYKNNIYMGANNLNKCARLNGDIDIIIDTTIYGYHNGVKRYRLLLLDEFNAEISGAKLLINGRDEDGNELNYITLANSNINESWVELTRNDTTAKIISGRFEFVAYPGNPNLKPIRITEGRFDWTYPFSSECPLRF